MTNFNDYLNTMALDLQKKEGAPKKRSTLFGEL